MASETPSISSSNYANTSYTPGMWETGITTTGSGTTSSLMAGGIGVALAPFEMHPFKEFEQAKHFDPFAAQLFGEVSKPPAVAPKAPAQTKTQPENKVATRIVKVFIADTNENLPVEHQLLHRGEERLTDSTDQELFFEIPINEILKTHNELRSKTKDKKASERHGKEIFLEPVRIRDLKMIVVQVAAF